MKRVGFVIGIAAAASAALCHGLNGVSVAAAITTLAVGAAGLILFARKSAFFGPCISVVLTALLFFCRYAAFDRFTVEPVRMLDGVRSGGEIVITDVAEDDGSLRITGKVKEVGAGMPKNFKVRFYMPESRESPVPGDSVKADMRFRELSERYRRNDDLSGVYIRCDVGEIEKTGHKNTVSYALWRMRRFVENRLFKYLPYDEASLLNGLLLSDTSMMTPAVYGALRRCGLLHLTAVSGMHLSVFCFTVYGFLRKFLKKRKSALITMPFVLAVMGMAGFTASVVRAGIMAFIMLAGDALFRRSDSLNSLGLAAAAMLFWNPNAILGRGFALSYLAMLGMLIVAPRISAVMPTPGFRIRPLNIAITYILTSLVCTVSAVLCTAPAGILFFGEFSLLSPVLCLLCTAPAMFAMVLGAAAVFLPFLFYPVRLPLLLVLRITALFSELPAASVNAASRFMKPWIAATLILAGAAILLRIKRPLVCVALSAVLLAVSVLGFHLFDRGVIHIAVANTYNGMAVLMVKDRSCVAVGIGGEEAEAQTDGYCDGLSVKNWLCALFPSEDKKYFADGAWNYADFTEIFLPSDNIGLKKSLESVGKNVLPIENAEIEPFEGLRLAVVPAGAGYAVQWQSGDITGFVLTGADAAPEGAGGADYIISDAPPPENCGGEGTRMLMVGEPARSAGAVSEVLKRGMETYVVEPGDTAELMIRNGSSVKLRLAP